MSQELTPALTPEEWASALRAGPYVADEFDAILWSNGVMIRSLGDEQPTAANQDRHALAALCLYQQPFGFTQEDVTALQVEGNELTAWANDAESDQERERMLANGFRLLSLAKRISALLPTASSSAPSEPDPSK